jgi:protein TonB
MRLRTGEICASRVRANEDARRRTRGEDTMSSYALFEFMPYGAPELITGAPKRMFRATIAGMVLWVAIFAGITTAILTRPRTVEVPTRVLVVPYRELAAPPPLVNDVPPPPQIAVTATRSAPAVGMPVPVPDVQAPPEQTIASQEEIAAATGSETTGGGDAVIVVQPPAAEELPKLGEFVYTDELPVLVTDVLPRYPELARTANVEGDVLLRVLVGKDGRVMDVHVDQSIPMLDDAAIAAARQWVFKPALSNNRPVVVWISRQVHFRLQSQLGS